MLHKRICTTCGTQYPEGFSIDSGCPICNDDRQYVPDEGQGWTDLEKLQNKHSIILKQLNEQLYELKITPPFAIGQRALLVVTPGGNILWDCIALINEPVVEFIRAKGGLKAIALSHPHYYTVMNEWANAFDCPIYIHEKDAQWVFNKGKHVTFWGDVEKELWYGIKLINVGGHFPGSSILHLSSHKTILCGDTFYLSPGKKHLAVMYSYPNRIPLPLHEVQRIKAQMLSIPFDTLFGFYDYQNLIGNAKEILEQSLSRYQ
jgi:hypothetical protein